MSPFRRSPEPTASRKGPWKADAYLAHERYAPRGLTIIAIHSPEFDFQRDPTAVAANVRKLGIDYPVLDDNAFQYWKALDNRNWPVFYLIDSRGRITATRIGELHAGHRSSVERTPPADARLRDTGRTLCSMRCVDQLNPHR